MKTRIFNLLLIFLILMNLQANADRISKRIYKSFPVSQVAKLELSNKYGNIQIDDNRKDSVVINVMIWVDGSGNRAQRLLDNIDVNISSSGNTVSASTEFDSDLNSNMEFSIDYVVSVPADRDLSVEQKYGNVNMNNLTGKGIFDIKYGEIRAKNLLSPGLNIELGYSKAYIEATKNMELSIKYSKLTLEKADNVNVESRYSGLSLGDCKDVTLDSRYDDFKFKTINSLVSNAMYTGCKIEKLLSSLALTNGYGNFTVGAIPAGFKNIKVSSRYASVRLGIEAGASYRLDGNVRYCELKHPDGKLNKMREDNSYEVHGTVGKSESPSAAVNIESSYGNVSLVQ